MQNDLISAVGERRGVAAADRLCEACVELLALDSAAISLVFDGASTGTLGASSNRARVLDEVQFTVGEGPCLESVMLRSPVLVLDLAADVESGRWLAYGPTLLAYGIASVCAVPVLVAGQYLGALDLFRTQVDGFGERELAGAMIAAELAELPMLDLLDADLHAVAADPRVGVWDELHAVTRAEVSQATGMLVAQLGVQPAEALLRLRAHAFASGRSATAVAQDILERRLRLDPE